MAGESDDLNFSRLTINSSTSSDSASSCDKITPPSSCYSFTTESSTRHSLDRKGHERKSILTATSLSSEDKEIPHRSQCGLAWQSELLTPTERLNALLRRASHSDLTVVFPTTGKSYKVCINVTIEVCRVYHNGIYDVQENPNLRDAMGARKSNSRKSEI